MQGKLPIAHLTGADDFEKALRILNGEEKLPEPKSNDQKDPEDDQIDTNPKTALPPTLDVLDPVFAKALSSNNIQSIKDQDQMLKKLTTATPFAAQKQTFNDFISRQSPEVKKQILMGLEQHQLSHLTPELFAEARRVRPPTQAGRGNIRRSENRQNTRPILPVRR